ncbi:MAG: ABC transporter ATP-binding protein [Candidatus Bathyarchaeia archaeon]
MSESFLLQIIDLSKIFGYGFLGRIKFPAVDHVSLAIENKPKIFTIAGESGCGKTTLARIILGIIEPSMGRILYKGKDLHKISSKDKLWFLKEVQGVFQDPYDTFNPLKKVETYLYETTRNLLGVKDYEAASKYIDDTLSFMGLSFKDVKGKYPREFSGGELQRVSIARALLSKPNLMIVDEPVSMIDASMRMNILNMFKSLRDDDKVSFIYITHDLATAYYISDDIAIMYRGVVVEAGPAEKVLIERYHPYTKALIEALPEYSKRSEWFTKKTKPPGIEVKEFAIPYCKYAHLCRFKMDICTQKRPPMIDVNGVKVSCWLYKE